ncbi:BMP family lipoprotein [Sedimentibacter sp. MB31-C6]|uniref:BMP family lipoprotein n=1 Tax=Sedimentibacter sp. MB31-C6 TaxID=3109366 RepID=UPI002DDDA0A6|nr:BMP family ABC transporter substrate-binding protein [Sedimentibacter sp. MB36-C1]WSI03261.1 BMP family ABC transporter substrate-binding protein [Sedimentibacter sp. MB36-C1]
MKHFKKLLSIILIASLVLSLSACTTETPSNTETDTTEETDAPETEGTEEEVETETDTEGFELALITDVGTIDDKSFNQGAWEGVEAYAKEFNITYKYYKPTEKSDSAYINSIDLAVKAGAKVVVCPGFLFEVPIHTVQTQYPDVKFVILDGAPHSGDYNIDIAPNTYSIFYAEEEAGFLAGYSIVKEGYTKLGFMGGMAVPAVVRFGYGFVQGADYAAKELGLTDDIQVKYTYVGNFDASPENQAKASSWYNEGTEVIFACGGAVGNSVMKAAETAGTNVIGVDVDQSEESDTVITSSMKNLSKSVYDALADYYADSFPGGTSVTLDATVEGVQLPMNTSRFEKFAQDDYDSIYEKVVAKEIEILNDTDVAAIAEAEDIPAEEVTAANIPTEQVTVEVIQ